MVTVYSDRHATGHALFHKHTNMTVSVTEASVLLLRMFGRSVTVLATGQ